MMSNPANLELVELLDHEVPDTRMLALNWLGEGYACESEITDKIFAGWDRLGVEDAYPEFPGLYHLPISSQQIPECLGRSSAMHIGHKLTDKPTRIAGKLLEHVSKLPAVELQPHLEQIRETVAESKIFFRVDVPALENRIRLLSNSADSLAGELDSNLALLIEDHENATATHSALHALEALRRQHPSYMDLGAVLANTPTDDGRDAVGFQITLQSLLQYAQAGLESQLGKHLLDHRESVFIPISEALVRTGSAEAADALIAAFPNAEQSNQQWIARGLQRIRVKGIAEQIAALRATTQDDRLWLMLLVAEIRQTDPEGVHRILADVSRVGTHSYALTNALILYSTIMADNQDASLIHSTARQYFVRSETGLKEALDEKSKQSRAVAKRQRDKSRQQLLNRLRNQK